MDLSKPIKGLEKLKFWAHFWFNNRFSTKSVLSEIPVVVSLTSHGDRVFNVYLTIESIASGRMRPGRLILWLDDMGKFQHLPKSIVRLQKRGLEVKLADNYGPHTKYYPYVKQYAGENIPLVTADDDIFYPDFWLQGLYAAYQGNPSVVSCYRAHLVALDQTEEKVAPFFIWTMCQIDKPSFLNHATGVSGVIYPPKLQQALSDAGEQFMDLCPKADDIWLHVNAIRNGFRVKQIFNNDLHFRTIPFTQKDGLIQQNAHQGLNTIQADKTYTSADIAVLRQESSKSSRY